MDSKVRFSLGGLVALLTLPAVHAAVFDSISKSMGTAWNAVGAIFSFEYVSRSPGIQEGIMKFLIFIMLLAVVQKALMQLAQSSDGKPAKAAWLDRKTSGIIAFVVAATTVIFTPNVFIFSALILLLVPVTLAILGWMWSIQKMKESPWFSTLTLFILLILLEFLDGNVYTRSTVPLGKMFPFTQQVMSILILVTSILFVWKLFSAIFTIGGKITAENIKKARELMDTPVIARAPGRPREVAFALKEPGSVRVTWSDPVEGEKVVRYWIQHRYGDVTIGWNTIEKNRPYGQPHELIVSAIEKTTLDVTRPMQFRVCASGRNTPGGYGEWAYSEVRAPKETPTRPLSANENAGEDKKNPPTPEEEKEKEPPQAPVPTPAPQPPVRPGLEPSNPTETGTPVVRDGDETITEGERQKLMDGLQHEIDDTTRPVQAGVDAGINADTTFHDEGVDKALADYYQELQKLTKDISAHNPLDRNASPNLKRILGKYVSKEDVIKGQAYTTARNAIMSVLERYLEEAKIPQSERKLTFGNVLFAMEQFIVTLLDLVSHASIWHAQLPTKARDHEAAQKLHDANERHLREVEKLAAFFKELEQHIPRQEAIIPAPTINSTDTPFTWAHTTPR